MNNTECQIVDITNDPVYDRYLYKCLAPQPFRRYVRRYEYLEHARQKGFHKKILIVRKDVVGSIEYAPAEASGYPILGDNVIVMNCVWILRKAKGHDFGRLLVKNMVQSERKASSFSTIALANHWSPWFKRIQIERLGFRPLDSISVTHVSKHKNRVFQVFLMWMPIKDRAQAPTWDRKRLLDGETFCLAHPLYRPQTCEGSVFSPAIGI